MNTLQQEVKLILNKKPILMDSFDSSYLYDFHHIMRENFNVTNINDPILSNIISILNFNKKGTIKDLRDELLNSLNEDDFRPKISSDEMKKRFRYTEVNDWDNMKNVRFQDNKEKAKEFLINYSKQSGGSRSNMTAEEFKGAFGRNDDLRKKQTALIKSEIKNHENNSDFSILTLGPRWSAEIDYLRQEFNVHAMGLDLFSYDKSKVIAGDMHDMPIEDNSYNIVYEKNTYNKAYDIRKALDESLRVLKSGGLLIYDECMDYTCGVNENARTNIKSHSWTLSYLKDKVDEVLINEELPSNTRDRWWINKVGLLIVRIK